MKTSPLKHTRTANGEPGVKSRRAGRTLRIQQISAALQENPDVSVEVVRIHRSALGTRLSIFLQQKKDNQS
jgi:hypothetical protein